MPEKSLRLLPVHSKKVIIGYAIVLDDEFTRDVLAVLRWSMTAGYPSNGIGYLHHVVFRHYLGEVPSGHEIDHRDQDSFNAVPENLRVVTRSINIANSGMRRTNKSGYKGVSWDGLNKKWRASIMVNYKAFNLGRYESKEDAAKAVNDAYRRYFPTVTPPNEV